MQNTKEEKAAGFYIFKMRTQLMQQLSSQFPAPSTGQSFSEDFGTDFTRLEPGQDVAALGRPLGSPSALASSLVLEELCSCSVLIVLRLR